MTGNYVWAPRLLSLDAVCSFVPKQVTRVIVLLSL